jgi:hypothetical protein
MKTITRKRKARPLLSTPPSHVNGRLSTVALTEALNGWLARHFPGLECLYLDGEVRHGQHVCTAHVRGTNAFYRLDFLQTTLQPLDGAPGYTLGDGDDSLAVQQVDGGCKLWVRQLLDA